MNDSDRLSSSGKPATATTQFHRPPRIREVAGPVEISLPAPPAAPKRYPRSSVFKVLFIAILPSLLPPIALGVATLLIGAPSTMLITSAALMTSLALAVGITTVLTRRDEDTRIRMDEEEYQRQRVEFEAEVAGVMAECERVTEREARVLASAFPAPEELTTRAIGRSPLLWARRRADDDFLDLRLGLGRRRTCIKFSNESAATSGDPLLRSLLDQHTHHASVPVTVGLGGGTRAGVFGRDDVVGRQIAWLALQAATQHAPGGVALAVFSRDDALTSWAKWLPHCRLRQGRSSTTLIARSGTEATAVLRAINHDLQSRAALEDGPVYLVIADGRSWQSLGERMTRSLQASNPSVSVVLVQRTFEELSGDCDVVIDLAAPSRGVVRRRVESAEPLTFIPDVLDPVRVMPAALALAPLEAVESGARGTVPGTARLVDLLGGGAATAQAVVETWARTRRSFRLAAPIGVGAGDVPVEIDLRRDGPHALLAGTTGSGKSEFLQSLVVAFAAKIPPDLLNFVLIDYKGGSAFREVAALPHVVGVVTDLDERLSARALTSLRAEMRRREHLLATTTPPATNIIEYQSQPRDVPLANVLIIIDEFHRLVSEQPDFVDQMVQIAQQGRSLGVHLMLSTQKPSGVISDHIRANTNLRICLRVTDEADSRDVLGGPEAASIPRDLPGRVYIRAGNDPLVACQTGRVSGLVASTPAQAAAIEASAFLPPLAPRVAQLAGVTATASPVRQPLAVSADDEDDAPELVDERAQIIDAVCAAKQSGRFPDQAPPWQPYLPESLPLEQLPRASERTHAIAIGLLDEPEVQRQRPFEVDLDAGHICIAGGANTGKTTALLAIASAAARSMAPHELHVYGIDFAGGGLAPLDRLPHSGGVAAQHQPPRVHWVLQALKDIVGERLVQTSSSADASSWPRLLVLVDNFTGLYASLQNTEGAQDASEELVELMDLGRSVGVSFAISVERPESLRAAVLSMLQTRLVLPLTDPEGYSTFGMSRVPRSADPIAGRALVPGHIVHEVQIADPWPVLNKADATPATAFTSADGLLRIAPLPPSVSYAALIEASADDALPGMLLGLREGTRPSFRYPGGEHLTVLGPRRSGRSNALAVAVLEARRNGVTKLFVVNPRRSSLLREATLMGEAPLTRYAERDPEISAMWEEIMVETAERFASYANGGDPAGAPWAIVIDDADVLDLPPDVSERLAHLALRGADIGATIIAAADTQALRAAYPSGFTRALLNARTGILLGPLTTDDFDLLGVRGKPSRMPAGRGYVCSGGNKHSVQIALSGGSAL